MSAHPVPHEAYREASTTDHHTVKLGASEEWNRLAEEHRRVTLEAAAQRREHSRERAEEEAAREVAARPPAGSPQADHETPESFFRRLEAEREWQRVEREDEA